MDMEYEGEDTFVPGEAIPESSVIPAGTYELIVNTLNMTRSRADDGRVAKRMVSPVFEVAAGPYEGTTINYSPFVLGTDLDPMARNPETWTHPQKHRAFGVIRWGKFLDAINLRQNAMLSELCVKAEGRRFTAIVGVQVRNNPQSPFYGSEINVIPDNGWLKKGEQRAVAGMPSAIPGDLPPVGGGPLSPPQPQSRPVMGIPGVSGQRSANGEAVEATENAEIPF